MTEKQAQEIIDRLERIEQRLDELAKKDIVISSQVLQGSNLRLNLPNYRGRMSKPA